MHRFQQAAVIKYARDCDGPPPQITTLMYTLLLAAIVIAIAIVITITKTIQKQFLQAGAALPNRCQTSCCDWNVEIQAV
jgi:hypothetical protein